SLLAPFGSCLLAAVAWTCAHESITRSEPRPAVGWDDTLGVTGSVPEFPRLQTERPTSAAAKTRPSQPRLTVDPSQPLGIEIRLEDPNGRSLRSLHAALRRAASREGQARLLFYGASHVASDLFTGYIRRELQSRFGDAGRGIVLPV